MVFSNLTSSLSLLLRIRVSPRILAFAASTAIVPIHLLSRQASLLLWVVHETEGPGCPTTLQSIMKGDALNVGSLSTLAGHENKTAFMMKKNHRTVAILLVLQRHYFSQAALAAAASASTDRKSKKDAPIPSALVFGMIGLTYASVPLYRRFGQLTRYGGAVQCSESVEEKIARHEKD